eukprot:7607440-Pyramimonas_sp.AAC.1
MVSIALTLWAIWGPSAPCGAQWVGSPMGLNRPFAAHRHAIGEDCRPRRRLSPTGHRFRGWSLS